MKNVAIVGLGFMGKMHYDVYKARQDVRIAAIADGDERKLRGDWSGIGGNIKSQQAAPVDLAGVKTVTDYHELLGEKGIDLVDICLPTFLHRQAASDFLAAGHNVLLEKPICLSLKDARALLAVKKKARGHFMVAQCLRFWPEYVWTADAIRKQAYGRVVHASFRRVSPPVFGWQSWFRDPSKSRGALLDLHIHDVDFIRWVFGMPLRLQAVGRADATGLAHIYVNYQYEGMAIACEGGWDMPTGYPFNMAFAIHCEKATIELDLSKSPSFAVHHLDGRKETPAVAATTGYHQEIDYFLRVLDGAAKQTVIRDDEILDVLALIDKEEQSVRTGRTVAC